MRQSGDRRFGAVATVVTARWSIEGGSADTSWIELPLGGGLGCGSWVAALDP